MKNSNRKYEVWSAKPRLDDGSYRYIATYRWYVQESGVWVGGGINQVRFVYDGPELATFAAQAARSDLTGRMSLVALESAA